MGLCCSRNCNQTSSDKCKSPCSPLSLTPIPITKVEKAQQCVLSIRDREKQTAQIEVSLTGNIVTSGAPVNHAMSKLSTIVKGKVSKKRVRYQQDGYDLDLTYITPNIIAMGYPASNIEAVYRNNIEDVARFLDGAHKDHYKIYNLCSERAYDTSKFHNRVEVFPFDDHNPPKLELIQPFCHSVEHWLKQMDGNVAVVHCKAGKGRTGTMICCYLLHSGIFCNSEDALNHYGSKRTQDMKGVTIPSQLRYVNYYARLVRDSMKYRPVQVYIKEVILEPSPCFSGGNMGTLCFSISQPIPAEGQNGQPYQKLKKVLKSEEHDVKKSVPKFSVQLDSCSPLVGDVKVEFYYKMLRKEKLFQFWFNTFFVCEKVHVYDSNGCVNRNGSSTTTDELLQQQTFKFTLSKKELDIVNKKDKQNKMFSSDFHITLLLSRVPTRNPQQQTNHINLQSNPNTTSSPVHNYPYAMHQQPQQRQHGSNGTAIQQQQHPANQHAHREFLKQLQQQQLTFRQQQQQQQEQQQLGGVRSLHHHTSGTGCLMTSASQGMIPQSHSGGGFNQGNVLNKIGPPTNPACNLQQSQPHTSAASSALPPHHHQQQQAAHIAICSDSSTSSSDDESSDGDGCCAAGGKDDDYNWDSGESQRHRAVPYDSMMNVEEVGVREEEEELKLLPPPPCCVDVTAVEQDQQGSSEIP